MSATKTNIGVQEVIDLLREKLPEEQATELISELNHRLKEIAAEESADAEPTVKKEWSFYYIYDKNQKETDGVAPEFVVKVPAQYLPTDVELFLQHAINEIKNESGKKKRKNKKRSGVNNLFDVASLAAKKHFEGDKRVFFVSEEPIVPLPVNVTY